MAAPRKSIAQHRLEGTKPHYDVGDVQSRFEAGDPERPAHLTKAERSAWNKQHKIQKKRGTETPADALSHELHAVVKARWLQAKTELGDKLLVESLWTDKLGIEHCVVKLNPLLSVIKDCEIRLLILIKELGLSPSSRERTKPTKSDATPTGESMGEMYPHLYGKPALPEKAATEKALLEFKIPMIDEDEENETDASSNAEL